MATSSERRALLLLAAVISLGVLARAGRAVRARPAPTLAERRALDAQIARVESARSAKGTVVKAAKVVRRVTMDSAPQGRAAGPLTDMDAATSAEIERLPYVGRVLATRIVANRDSCGPFGSIGGLTRVTGIGEGLARRLAPLVTFSGTSRPLDASRPPGCSRAGKSAALRRRGRP